VIHGNLVRAIVSKRLDPGFVQSATKPKIQVSHGMIGGSRFCPSPSFRPSGNVLQELDSCATRR
jgi:hypothetical protein